MIRPARHMDRLRTHHYWSYARWPNPKLVETHPNLGGHLKSGQTWTGQNRPVRTPGRGDIYLVASSAGKDSPILVRQLRGPHLRTWPWWSSRSSMAATAAASPRTLPQSSTGRFEVNRVLAR